jgi:precorrin-8X/cobalt-precorrin-8 methylmutase
MNCSLCKYRVQIVGYEKEVGTPQQGHHLHVRGGNGSHAPQQTTRASAPHPIEAESFRIISAGRDWAGVPELQRRVARLVHAKRLRDRHLFPRAA